MKKIIITAFAASALLSSPAIAADIPAKGPVYKAAPGYNWTGWYGGINVGYGIDPNYWLERPVGTPDVPLDLEPKGFFGGLQIGYNWQYRPNWVFGIEGDFQFSDIKDTYFFNYPGGGASFAHLAIKQFATLRGRIGYTMDRNLYYFTAGGAIANFKANLFADFDANDGFINGNSKWIGGYVVGFGWERALNNRWTWKVEYLFIDFSHLDIRGFETGAGTPIALTGDPYLHIVRLALNLRFATGQP
jgi:outer membrane immunogenic protein